MIIFQNGSILIEECAFSVSTRLSKLYIQPNIIHSSKTPKSNAKLFKNASNIPKSKLPAEVANIVDIQNPTTHTKVADFFLENANFSLRANETTSVKAIMEVIPANNIHAKNKGPITSAQGFIRLNTFGNTTNAKPVPSVTNSLNGIPLVKVMNPKIEKIPIALKISKPELENATINALLVNLEVSGR